MPLAVSDTEDTTSTTYRFLMDRWIALTDKTGVGNREEDETMERSAVFP
jgi:hypothetical protein